MTSGGLSVILDAPQVLRPVRAGAQARFRISAGDSVAVRLLVTGAGVEQRDDSAALDATMQRWRDWTSDLRYTGPRRFEVIRSAITLKR